MKREDDPAHAAGREGLCAARRLVAVVAPQVLPGAFAHQVFERAVQVAHRRLAGNGRRQRLQHAGGSRRRAAAARRRQESRRRRRAARAAARSVAGVGELAEELRPFTLPFARHLVGKKTRRLAALQRGEHRPHAARVRRCEAHAAPAAARAHQRLEPGQLRRAIEHRHRHALRRVLRRDLEATHVRREEEQRLARGARASTAAMPCTSRTSAATRSWGSKPDRGRFGDKLPACAIAARRTRASP